MSWANHLTGETVNFNSFLCQAPQQERLYPVRMTDPIEVGTRIRAAREAKGWSQADLARATGIKQQSIDAVEKGATRRSKFLPEIVAELGIDPEAVGLPKETMTAADGWAPASQILQPGRDFPIHASAEGGPGEIIRSAEPVDWYPRPAQVAHVREAYGLFVVGESMAPEFDPGDIALVNPILPPLAGKPCIFYTELHGEARATIKRFLRASGSVWHVFQHNPPRGMSHEFTLSKKEWGICHRVLGKYYPQ